MVCPFDRAQALEQRQRDQAINAQLAQARRESAGPSLTHCQDCDNEIPPARQALGGKTRCVPCQSSFEKGVLR
ncbi:TraR/DksA family transcriptional regulator [Pseudomonas fluorescens]|uniref:TraR/DksA C4-type zinc finger protein n=1 Tax=Pseudomonas TaxID=286 RepID=UPI000D36AAD9|nr:MULTISPECIES: TraR/DksA C4-type zinc finger protein [Pseudomonas]NKI46501.1 TraR/DksA family transcriptional regulator [Pseudomonas fluorescens]MDI3183559.1 TraR/DksA C4-type zinc finger protein [Pseudomonas paracarnis]NKI51516.1 TraR/DksA family transcriptional regulator [Pseudomonas fluorescens]NKI64009.1 TraR/DksA family transcriptional regulator [Pseudomonas fluorescens]PTT08552.1 conjugal transfer protein TraR [Pseudomonas sp. HMWF034]